MRQRIAIAISSITAAAVLAIGLTAAGFGPGNGLAATDPPAREEVAAQAPEPEIVYVQPAPERETVVVTKKVQKSSTAKARANKAKPVRRTTVGSTRERDDEHEREHEREHHEREHEREDDD